MVPILLYIVTLFIGLRTHHFEIMELTLEFYTIIGLENKSKTAVVESQTYDKHTKFCYIRVIHVFLGLLIAIIFCLPETSAPVVRVFLQSG
jgi:hypothetical protein